MWESQKKKDSLWVQDFSKRSARVPVRLHELEKVRDRIIKQFVTETRDCPYGNPMSDYLQDEETLTA